VVGRLIFGVFEILACPWQPQTEVGPVLRKGIEEPEIWEALVVVEAQHRPYAKTGGGQNAL
jgi:hypothetical protein